MTFELTRTITTATTIRPTTDCCAIVPPTRLHCWHNPPVASVSATVLSRWLWHGLGTVCCSWCHQTVNFPSAPKDAFVLIHLWLITQWHIWHSTYLCLDHIFRIWQYKLLCSITRTASTKTPSLLCLCSLISVLAASFFRVIRLSACFCMCVCVCSHAPY